MHILSLLEPHQRRPGYVSTLLVRWGLLWVVRPHILFPVLLFFFLTFLSIVIYFLYFHISLVN